MAPLGQLKRCMISKKKKRTVASEIGFPALCDGSEVLFPGLPTHIAEIASLVGMDALNPDEQARGASNIELYIYSDLAAGYTLDFYGLGNLVVTRRNY